MLVVLYEICTCNNILDIVKLVGYWLACKHDLDLCVLLSGDVELLDAFR